MSSFDRRQLLVGSCGALFGCRANDDEKGAVTASFIDVSRRLVGLVPPEHLLLGLSDALEGRPADDLATLARTLVEPILAPGEAVAALLELSDALLRRRLRAAVSRDYHEERLVSAAGWLLSSTEAALCGLARHLARTS
ncbi:MAG TPA: hypothetical protein VF989_21200 [Polyangiaceae bacterium]|jgi:hypothetical protein